MLVQLVCSQLVCSCSVRPLRISQRASITVSQTGLGANEPIWGSLGRDPSQMGHNLYAREMKSESAIKTYFVQLVP